MTELRKKPAADLPLPWRLLEAYFHRVYRIETLEDDPESLLAFNPCRHRGPEVRLACGEVVRAGDPLLELHFRREALLPLMRAGDPARLGIGLIRLGDRDIPRLARALAEDPRLREVKAVHALTLFNRGLTRWGFEVREVEDPWAARWFTGWHRVLMARDHPGGAAHVREHRDRLVTRHVWASRAALMRKYGAAPPPPGAADLPAPPERVR